MRVTVSGLSGQILFIELRGVTSGEILGAANHWLSITKQWWQEAIPGILWPVRECYGRVGKLLRKMLKCWWLMGCGMLIVGGDWRRPRDARDGGGSGLFTWGQKQNSNFKQICPEVRLDWKRFQVLKNRLHIRTLCSLVFSCRLLVQFVLVLV